MAKDIFQPDRRQVLMASVAIPAAHVSAEFQSKGSVAIQSAATIEKTALDLCAANARRVVEIAWRNEIRREAGLPLLGIAKELKRLKAQDDAEKFEAFAAEHRAAAWAQVLRSRRETTCNPDWRPTWMEGLVCQNEVRQILWRKFRAVGQRSLPFGSPHGRAVKSPS